MNSNSRQAHPNHAPKICHVSSVHDALDDRVFHRECVTLAQAGFPVVIVAPADGDQVLANVRIRALPRPQSRGQRVTRTVWSACSAALAENADLYHLHDPELLPFGFVLRLFGKRVIYDAHEDLPDDMMAKQWVPRALRAPLAHGMSCLTWLSGLVCTGIVAATPGIAKRFPSSKTAVVQNFPRADIPSAAVAGRYDSRPKTAVYAGSITQSRGILQMIDAFSHPQIPHDARLIIAGSFSGYEGMELERAARSSPGWQHVDFLGWKPYEDTQRLLQAARIGLVLLHPQKSFLESQPTKLFEYMAAGIPVIASDFPLWRDIIEGAACGVLVDPLDCDAIARAIVALLADPAGAEAMGRRGQEAARVRYGWAEQADRLLHLYAHVACRSALAVVPSG